MNNSTYFTAFIVKTDLFLESNVPSMADFCQDFLDFLAPFRTKCIYLEKKMQYLVYFLFSQEAPSSHQIHAAGEFLCNHFEKYASVLYEKSCTSFSLCIESIERGKNNLFFPSVSSTML